jgi:hypothetical protein
MRERLRRALGAHPLISVAVAVGLLVLAALTVPDKVGFEDGDGAGTVLVPDPPALASFLLVILAFALLILYIVSKTHGPRRLSGAVPVRKRRNWLQAVGFLALPVMWLVSRPFREALDRLVTGEAGETAARNPGPPGAGGSAITPESSAALGLVLTLALLVLVLGTFYLIYAMSRRDAVSDSGGNPPRTIQAAIALGMEDLQHIRSPREAVIACYSRLQDLADRVGARRDADTPAELMSRLIGTSEVSPSAVSSLTVLFERAKFSRHEIDEEMRDQALKALREIRQGLIAGG